MWRTFPNLGVEKTFNKESNGTSTTANHRLDSSHVKATLRQLGITFKEDACNYTVERDVTPCIIGADTEDGNMLLDFLTHTLDFKRQADGDLYKAVLVFLRDSCVQREGEFYFQSQSDVLIITK